MLMSRPENATDCLINAKAKIDALVTDEDL